MPHEGIAYLGTVDAAAVVGDADKGDAAFFHFQRLWHPHPHPGHFHQLFHHAAGAFYHFACRNFINGGWNKNLYCCHGFPFYGSFLMGRSLSQRLFSFYAVRYKVF